MRMTSRKSSAVTRAVAFTLYKILMTFHARQFGEWMFFSTKPLCFQAYQQVGPAKVPEWQLKQFLNEQIEAVRVTTAPHKPAW